MRLTRLLFISGALFALQSCGNKGGEDQTASADSTLTVYSELHDFESMDNKSITSEKAASGKKSAMLADSIEYGVGLAKHFKEISSFNSIDEINISFKCWMDKQYADATFVISIDDSTETKNIMWEGKPVVCSKLNDWSDVQYNFKLNHAFVTPESVIKLYIWNKGKNKFYFDDLSFEFVKIKK